MWQGGAPFNYCQIIAKFHTDKESIFPQPARRATRLADKKMTVRRDQRESLPGFAENILLDDLEFIPRDFGNNGNVSILGVGKNQQVIRARFFR